MGPGMRNGGIASELANLASFYNLDTQPEECQLTMARMLHEAKGDVSVLRRIADEVLKKARQGEVYSFDVYEGRGWQSHTVQRVKPEKGLKLGHMMRKFVRQAGGLPPRPKLEGAFDDRSDRSLRRQARPLSKIP